MIVDGVADKYAGIYSHVGSIPVNGDVMKACAEAAMS